MPATKRSKKKNRSQTELPANMEKPQPNKGEDLVGKLLVSTFGAAIAGATSLALQGQINWLWVVLVFFISLTILIVYQKWRK